MFTLATLPISDPYFFFWSFSLSLIALGSCGILLNMYLFILGKQDRQLAALRLFIFVIMTIIGFIILCVSLLSWTITDLVPWMNTAS